MASLRASQFAGRLDWVTLISDRVKCTLVIAAKPKRDSKYINKDTNADEEPTMTQQGGVAQPPYPREPNVHSGGKQDPGPGIELPPYASRQTEGPGADKDKLLEERGGVPGHEAGPRDVSPEERAGYSDTDTAPKDIHGVGASTSTSGQDSGSRMSEAAHTKDRFDGGIADSTTNVDPDSPKMGTGDQGG